MTESRNHFYSINLETALTQVTHCSTTQFGYSEAELPSLVDFEVQYLSSSLCFSTPCSASWPARRNEACRQVIGSLRGYDQKTELYGRL